MSHILINKGEWWLDDVAACREIQMTISMLKLTAFVISTAGYQKPKALQSKQS